MKRLVKIVGIGLAGLALIAVGLVAFLVMRNLSDDALDADVAKLLAMSPPQIAAADNGYFAWIGVVGRETEAPHAWGRRWYEQALEADKRKHSEDAENARLPIEGETRSERFAAKDLLCDKPESCLDEVAAAPERAVALVVKADATLTRGYEAMQFPAYQEAWRPDFNFRSSFPAQPSHWRQLSATHFALAVVSDRHDEALAMLERQMRFHVRQMQGAATLLEKIIAIGGLRGDYQLLNSYLERYPAAARSRAERIGGLLKPLPPDALGMRTAMATECRAALRMLLSLKEEAVRKKQAAEEDRLLGLPAPVGDFLAMPLYLPNATANDRYRTYRAVFDLDDKSGEDYRLALATIRQRDEPRDFGFEDLVIRNPIGHILLRVGTPDFEPYYLKRDDLLVLRASVALQLDLLRRGIRDDESIRRTISEAELVHSFTGETPVWDSAKRKLTYQAQPGRKGQPLVLAIGS